MRILGVDPSLTNYGWAIHDDSYPVGSPDRCEVRGRFKTPSKMEFVVRYMTMRDSLRDLIREYKPDRVGIEYPVFNNLYSEGMYGLFLYTCEALRSEHMDVVFWSPLQAKAHARDSIDRPKGWKMDKADMVEAAKKDVGGGRNWNHNEADAYLVAVLSGRFWKFFDGALQEGGLTPTEFRYFTAVHTFKKGKRAGKTIKKGVIHREDERFFRWSQLRDQGETNAEKK
jgi:Holliday junction resolvasome RuvABC endonuclease subunit